MIEAYERDIQAFTQRFDTPNWAQMADRHSPEISGYARRNLLPAQ
jgi:hypothetical protein